MQIYKLLTLGLIIFCQQAYGQLFINEVQSSNKTTIADNFGEYDDWIEIYNSTNTTIDLGNYYLSDDKYYLTKFKIPATNTIAANGFLVFWADGQVAQGINHCNFKISAAGETIYLTNADGITIIDSLSTNGIPEDYTLIRKPDGSPDVFTTSTPSANASNSNSLAKLPKPIFNFESGVYTGSLNVAISTTVQNANIYYTLDGSMPTANNGILYNNSISINSTTNIRAIVTKNGFEPSWPLTKSYILNFTTDLPIVNLVADPVYLYSDTAGILVTGTNGIIGYCDRNTPRNYNQDWEVSANFTYFENNNFIDSKDVGLKVSGNCKRKFEGNLPLALYFRDEYDEYGDNEFEYKIFDDNELDKFKRLYLRTGTNVPSYFFADLATHRVVANKLNVPTQSGKYAVVFINGVYTGVQDIREKFDKHHLKNDNNCIKNKDSIDIIKNPGRVSGGWWAQERAANGDMLEWNQFMTEVEGLDLTIDQNFEHIKSKINLNVLYNELLINDMIANLDWVGNNVKVFKEKGADNKWVYCLNDADNVLRQENINRNMITENILKPNPRGSVANYRASLLNIKLFENEEFKNEYIQRMLSYLQTVLKYNRFEAELDAQFNLLDTELDRAVNLYPTVSKQDFLNRTDEIKASLFARKDSIIDIHKAQFNLEPIKNLNLNFDNLTNGSVRLHTNFLEIPFNFTNQIYSNIPLWVHAVPKPGHRFVEWGGINHVNYKFQQNLYKSYAYNKNLTPIFEPALDVVINEIHYNPLSTSETEEFIELYNPDANAKSLWGYQFIDGFNFTFPEGSVIQPNEYIVIAKDSTVYAGNGYQVFQWECGSLNNDGEAIVFANPNKEHIDTVYYNDNINWPQNADGLGYSLALLKNVQNNNLPTAWAGQTSTTKITPGAVNDFCVPVNNSPVKANVSCYQANDGFIVNQISGGTAPFTYSWSNGATSSLAGNLPAGQYTVTITDFYNCAYVETFNISEPLQLSASISSTHQSYYQTNNGTATINVSGGVAPYTYSWSNGASTSTITNLAPGTYDVNVYDAQGCPQTESVNVQEISCNTLVANVTAVKETCLGEADGMLSVSNISNGTLPYSILWSNGITDTLTNNLAVDTYQLTINDANGCPYQDNFTIGTENIIQASFNINNVSSANLNDGSIELIPSGGLAPYSFSWSNGTNNQNLNGAGLGVYSLTVTDANGCSKLFEQLIIGNECVVSMIQQNNQLISSQVYQVAQYIQSNGMINATEQVSFKAGNYIELTNSFEVFEGAEFDAKIDGCQ